MLHQMASGIGAVALFGLMLGVLFATEPIAVPINNGVHGREGILGLSPGCLGRSLGQDLQYAIG